MRLFVALSIPAEVRANLSALIQKLRCADAHPRWVNPDNLHVTLKFIGEVSPQKVPAICHALATIQSPDPLHLEFRDVGFFPNIRRPSVAWIGITSPPAFALLAAEVNRVLAPLGIPREEKPFAPHLTIARFKENRIPPALSTEIEKWKDRGFGTFSAREIHLIESRLKSSGAQYTTLRSFPFMQKDSEGE
jgi:RNA 2',3'-cyclic 3'-phosphodiesterase